MKFSTLVRYPTLLALSLAVSAVPAISAVPAVSAADAGARGSGVAGRVTVTGLCRPTGHYRVVVTNGRSAGEKVVVARVILRGAGARVVWQFSSEATTTLADGSGVTAVAHGSQRSTERGVLTLRVGTPAGRRHSFGIDLYGPSAQSACSMTIAV
jgi:hypothetical protein